MNTAVHNWMIHLNTMRHLSPATIKAYKVDLEAWYAFLANIGVDGDSVEHTEVRSFMAFMSRKGMASASINRRLAALREFYKWQERRGIVKLNPFNNIKNIKRGKQIPGYLSYEEIEQFINATGNNFTGRRDRVLFEILYSTGCRVAEICSLNLEDLNRTYVTVRGKGSRDRLVFIGKKAWDALQDYLPLRLEHIADSLDSQQALLLNAQGHRLTTRGVRYIVNRYAIRLGIHKIVTPHSFRHTFATHLYDEGADIRIVQEMLGHASLSTTQIYTHTGIERIKNVYRIAHPHGKRCYEGDYQ